jgi:hypothetical protein
MQTLTLLLEYVAKNSCIKNETRHPHGKMGGIGICTLELNMEMVLMGKLLEKNVKLETLSKLKLSLLANMEASVSTEMVPT